MRDDTDSSSSELNRLCAEYMLSGDGRRQELLGQMQEVCQRLARPLVLRYEHHAPHTLTSAPEQYQDAVYDTLTHLLKRSDLRAESFSSLYLHSLHNHLRSQFRHFNQGNHVTSIFDDNGEFKFEPIPRQRLSELTDQVYSEELERFGKALGTTLWVASITNLEKWLEQNKNHAALENSTQEAQGEEHPERANTSTFRYHVNEVNKLLRAYSDQKVFLHSTTPQRKQALLEKVVETVENTLGDKQAHKPRRHRFAHFRPQKSAVDLISRNTGDDALPHL